ncbi:MAG: GntR family transcriptional regulator [Candidatus Promineifilaceae bacterium]|nr:GntR family transcriptional regulator [Candidatus Promineifilaceae bacterium]
MTFQNRLSASFIQESESLTDRVYELLRTDIRNNQMLPGTQLYEAAIARELGISRGPVREALLKLAGEGLVDIIPRRGAVVSSLTWKEFIDAYQIREALETLAVRLATPLLSAEDLIILTQLHEQTTAHAHNEEADAFFEANERFHHFFVDRSGNQKLIDLYRPLADQIRRYRMRSLTVRGGLVRSCAEHEAIVDAVRTKEADLAARKMKEHIQIPERILNSDQATEELELVVRES